MRLGPTGTPATIGPTVPDIDDDDNGDRRVWNSWRNENWRVETEIFREASPQRHFVQHKPNTALPGVQPGLGEETK
jgi:hypothetical protein